MRLARLSSIPTDRPRAVGAVLAFAALFLLAVFAVEELLPRRDWRRPPAWRKHPPFLPTFGNPFGLDKLEHAAAGFVCTLLVALALHLGLGIPRRSAALAAVVGVAGLWAGSIELVQGFLAYRNCELLDVVANLAGATLAVASWYALVSWPPFLSTRQKQP